MNIIKLNIEKLYGTYSYKVDMDKNFLLVLTGYNGTGKTTILNIVKSVAEANLLFFYELDFDFIDIYFEDNIRFCIKSENIGSDLTNVELDDNIKPEKYVTFTWWNHDNLIGEIKINKQNLHEACKNVTQVSTILDENEERLPDIMKNNASKIVKYLCDVQNAGAFSMMFSSVNTFMIPAQRVKQIQKVQREDSLYFMDEPTFEEIDTIDLVATSLQELLAKKQYEFWKRIQATKEKLIDSLLNTETTDLGQEKYTRIAEKLQETINDLNLFGLAYEKVREYNSTNGKLLSTYLLDMNETLSVYSDLLQELKLFSTIIAEKHFVHKTLKFSPKYGFKVFTDKGISIKPSQLSSGEQNIIILLYRIIFEVKNGDILLIDEPEISMHVVWLKEFIQDLRRIASTKQIQIIIATHSPQIVRGAENCYDLEFGNYGE